VRWCLQIPALIPAASLRLEVARVAARNGRLTGRAVQAPHLPWASSAALGHVAALLAWTQARHTAQPPVDRSASSHICIPRFIGAASLRFQHNM